MISEMGKWTMPGAATENGGSGSFLGKVGAGAMGIGAGLLGLWNEFGARLGVPGAREKADERIDQANKLFGEAGIGGGVMDQMAEGVLKAMQGLPNTFRQQLDELKAKLAPTEEGAAGKLEKKDLSGLLDKEQKLRKTDVTAWEKMGFVFSGGAVGATDATRSTANNTRTLVGLARETNDLLRKGGGASFANV
jgi:hypothetical protein